MHGGILCTAFHGNVRPFYVHGERGRVYMNIIELSMPLFPIAFSFAFTYVEVLRVVTWLDDS
jgi:hypothetical protein